MSFPQYHDGFRFLFRLCPGGALDDSGGLIVLHHQFFIGLQYDLLVGIIMKRDLDRAMDQHGLCIFFILVGADIQAGAQHFYVDRRCVYDKGMIFIFCHIEISLPAELHFPVRAPETFIVGDPAVSIQPNLCAIRQLNF